MPSRGQYWKKGGLIDETVKEEDLSQALQAKVNEGGHQIQDEGTPLTDRSELNFVGAGVVASDDGEKTVVTIAGGGGGGIDHFAQTELLEDFYWADPQNTDILILDKYGTRGTVANIGVDQIQSSVKEGGVVSIEVSSVSAGDGAGFWSTSGALGDDANTFNPSKNITMRNRSSITDTTTLRLDAIGLVDDNFRLSGASPTLANMDSSVDEGFYFKRNVDESSGNWIAVSNSQTVGSQTETDTGIAPTVDVFQNFEIIHTVGGTPTDVFKIDGNTVATHTTNVSTADVRMAMTNWIIVNTPTDDRLQELDLWHVVADR